MRLTSRLLEEARHFSTNILFSILLGLIGSFFGVFQAYQISHLIGLVFLDGKALEAVYPLIISILIIILIRFLFVYAGELSANHAARKIKQDLRSRLFTHIIELGPLHLTSDLGGEETRTGELVNLANEGMDALEVYFRQYLPQIALAALIPLAILFFIFPTDLLSGLVLLLTAPLLPLFMYLIGSEAETLTRKQWQGLSRMSAYFLDVLQGLTTLKSLGRSRDQIAIIKQVSEKYRQSTMGVLRVTFLSALVLELIATLSTAVVAVEIGIRLLYGQMAFEQAFFILLLAPEFYLPLRLLGTRFHAGMAGVEAANRIFEILNIPKESNGPFTTVTKSSDATKPAPLIVLNEVRFSYPNNQPALQNVSIVIPAGKVTAIIGESGSGKTTLTWLLLRFLKPQSGEIIANGQLLNTIPLPQWRENLAWVPQSPYLFNDTILANIKLAKPDADRSAILQAAHNAHVDEFIQDMPLGYETLIGERGVRLSAGQAQRIALARAFLKDAPMLILDEATSHLDPETDALFRQTFVDLARGRTVIVIAHNRLTLALADQVITLSHGKIESTHRQKPNYPISSFGQDTHTPKSLHHLHPGVTPELPMPEDSEREHQTNLAVESRLFKLVAPFIRQIIISVLLGFATVASGVGLMATAAYIISAAALHPSIAELQVAIVGVRFFGLSRGVFRYLERLVTHDATFRILARWRVWFYQALEPLAPARLQRYHSGDLLTRVINDIATLENFYVRTLAPPLVAFLVAFVSLLIMASFASQLAWVLLAFIILGGIVLPAYIYVISHQLGPIIINQRARLSTLLVDSLQGMADLLVFNQADAHLAQVNRAGDHLNQIQDRMNGLSALQTTLGSILANLAMLTVLILAIVRVNNGQMSGVYLGVVSLIALTCFEAMQPLPLASQYFDATHTAASRLYELVDARPIVVDPHKPLTIPPLPALEVHDLSFQYPPILDEVLPTNTRTFRLSDISFSLPHGKHVAIIGPNGAGKTTLTSLLLRLWEYQKGSIKLGAQEFHQYQQDDIRGHIAIVSQNTYLFTATIKENILLARPDATDEHIVNVSRQARLDDVIHSFPKGYDTWIGEHGLRLSAGERQRLSIARALLKDSPILILDEPTANLDPVTELAVLDSIRELSQGRSTITITQRLVGLEAMDEILVLNQGQIVEHGSHDQLIGSKGLYRKMWDLYHQTI